MSEFYLDYQPGDDYFAITVPGFDKVYLDLKDMPELIKRLQAVCESLNKD